MILTDIREVLGLNFGWDTERPGFRGFLQSFHSIAGIISQIRPGPLTSTSFQFIIQ
jgi:hypothetical protein